MSDVNTREAGYLNPSMEDLEEGVSTAINCDSSTTAVNGFSTPPLSTVQSPWALVTSPNLTKQHTSLTTKPLSTPYTTAHTPKAASPYTSSMLTPKASTPMEVTYMVEYMKQERQSAPLLLDPCLFPEGLRPGDVVDVWGKTNCGKSMLTLSLIASALLPKVWGGIRLGGCGTGVTLIDCDQQFSIFQLVNLMNKRVRTKLKQGKNALKNYKQDKSTVAHLFHSVKEFRELLQGKQDSWKTKIEEMVHSCLESLYYIKCKESEQFPVVLSSMEEHLAKHSNVSMLVVESLSAFCWYDCAYQGCGKLDKTKEYYDKLFGVLLKSTRKYKVVLLAVEHAAAMEGWSTRMDQARGKHNKSYQRQRGKRHSGSENNVNMEENDDMNNLTVDECLSHGWLSGVTWRVILSRVSPSSCNLKGESAEMVFSAEVVTATQRKSAFFVIEEEGVAWR